MKPLLQKDIAAFMQRFENFSDAEFRSVEILSPTNIKTTFALQDAGRAFDWISITLEFNDIIDAALVADAQVGLIDMSEGVTLSYDDSFTFQVNNATFFIKAKTLKYEEGNF